MPTSVKIGNGNGHKEITLRDSFYNAEAVRLGMSAQWVRETLANNFDGFNGKEIKQYRDLLSAEAYLVKTRIAILEKAQRTFRSEVCSVLGCSGTLTKREGVIVCTDGGYIHYLAGRLARIMNTSTEDALRELQERRQEYDIRQKLLREEQVNAILGKEERG